MSLKPLNDAIFGEPVVRDDYSDLVSEVSQLASAWEETIGRSIDPSQARSITAALAPNKVPYQVIVTAVGPDCREISVGDLAILPEGGGTMVTVTRNGEAERLYMISEKHVLAIYRDEEDVL